MPRRKKLRLIFDNDTGQYVCYDPDTDKWYGIRPTADSGAGITWGEPAVLMQVQFDKCCPRCGLERRDGFDLGMVRGRVFGARCPVKDGGCGWSY